MAKIKLIKNIDEETGIPFHYPQYFYWCEGCKSEHCFAIQGEGGNHVFNGDLNVPTVSPSLLERYNDSSKEGNPLHVCHSFIKAGVIQYLNDCTHPLAGHTMQLMDVDEKINERIARMKQIIK